MKMNITLNYHSKICIFPITLIVATVVVYFEAEKNKKIAYLTDIDKIMENMYKYLIPLYNYNHSNRARQSLESSIESWQIGQGELKKKSNKLFTMLAAIGNFFKNIGGASKNE